MYLTVYLPLLPCSNCISMARSVIVGIFGTTYIVCVMPMKAKVSGSYGPPCSYNLFTFGYES